MADTLKLTADAYFDNVQIVSFFSIPFLLAFAIPLLSPMPTYLALGATFLRTGSMYVDLTMLDAAVIVAAFLLSLFLVSFAIVAINLVIKSQRTFTSVKKEVINSIGKYVLNVFWLYLTAWALLLIVDLVGYEFALNNWFLPVAGIIVSAPLFFAPAAIVIDEQAPFQALKTSVAVIGKQPKLVLLWLLLAIASISAIDLLFMNLRAVIPFTQVLVLVANSLFIMPFLVMYQTQIYLTKYTILR
ncbi:MAG: hypothetical protein PHF51_01095 [Candidatus ainarchaeum sp.]|nr:hypothetical protein [Candidatus ainarchaeum sp.]